jgi:hypothetical protein
MVSERFPPHKHSIEFKLRYVASTMTQLNLTVGNIKYCEQDSSALSMETSTGELRLFLAEN